MSPTRLSEQYIAQIRNLMDRACYNPDEHDRLPCASACIVGDGVHKNSDLFAHVSSHSRNNHGEDVYWLASCTKLVTSIACMQLVEKRIINPDDASQMENLCPELIGVKHVGEDGSLEDKNGRITLRMLLTHTEHDPQAGFGYSFLNPKLQGYTRRCGQESDEFDEFSGAMHDFLQPLVNMPGERFEYGINMDWAGIVVERATNLTLNDYMKERIFEPLGIQDLSMHPTEDMKQRLQGIWQRTRDGKFFPRAYPLNSSLSATLQPLINSGGAGLFGSLKEFSKILATLLNDGTSPITGNSILAPDSITQMFQNQLQEWPDFGRQPLSAVKPELVHPADSLYPICPSPTPQGWGLGFMISPGPTGRSDSTAQWSGLSNVFWWCDREKKVAGVVGSQLLPFADRQTVQLWVDIESKVYEGLGQ